MKDPAGKYCVYICIASIISTIGGKYRYRIILYHNVLCCDIVSPWIPNISIVLNKLKYSEQESSSHATPPSDNVNRLNQTIIQNWTNLTQQSYLLNQIKLMAQSRLKLVQQPQSLHLQQQQKTWWVMVIVLNWGLFSSCGLNSSPELMTVVQARPLLLARRLCRSLDRKQPCLQTVAVWLRSFSEILEVCK